MTRSFLATFALIFASMAGLYLFDTFMARTEQVESHAEGQRLFHEGQKLLAAGRPAEAIESFRSALTFERENTEYQLALAVALLSSGKLTDAQAMVEAVRDRDPANGRANLAMARILVKQGRLADAAYYYRLAIYGKWPENAASRRLEVRLELVDLLAQAGNKQELLAELLLLQNENLDLNTRKHIAQLYLLAGSPNRAADMFREILREQPSDPDAFAGMGAAEFAKGNYRTAHVDFLIASRLKPTDPEIKKQLALSAEVLALDPMLRGLSLRERYKRSLRLLDLATQSVTQCLGPSAREPLLDEANAASERRVRPGQENEAVDSYMDLAEKIWQVRKNECKQPLTDDEQALSLVLTKIQ